MDAISNKNPVNKNFFPYNQQQTAENNSCQNPNAPIVTQSNDTLDGTSHENSGLNVDKLKSSAATTCDTIISQSSVRSVVCRSSEITSNTENLSLSFTEDCSTPQYETEPPPYNRAPDTNSPRIVLSHDRSLIPSLTTPNKDKKSWHEEEWSPKRKG